MLKQFVFYFVAICCYVEAVSSDKIKALYNSLDPLSVTQHLAFYELYGDSPQGKESLKVALHLLSNGKEVTQQEVLSHPFLSQILHTIVAIVNKQPEKLIPELTDQELYFVDLLAQDLPHRQLKGQQAEKEEDVLQLKNEEIDLARALFLTQLGSEQMRKIRSYEALLDLMALQIRARFSAHPNPEEKIRLINEFVFGEMGFRFPPHSLYAKDIDLYTFLPSVLDSRRGVCLGVSILYICLAQRLDLPLEMITPPGHIFVRYCNGETIINIETTARGIHLDSKDYLAIETCGLQQRTMKEVIGLTHFNQASVFWQQEKYAEALASYQKAEVYLPNDFLLQELKGYVLILNGDIAKGKEILEKIKNYIPDYAITRDSMAQDYLEGHCDEEGIKVIFKPVDETRSSIIAKREDLQKALNRTPQFKAALFSLAVAWIQLHRSGEALEVLQTYHNLDSNNPTAEYYLTILYGQRMDYMKSWEHFRCLEEILAAKNHAPKLLKDIKRELMRLAPQ